MRKTKIICTMGPSTDKGDVMEQLVREGMDVARFNFSHGPHDEQRGRIQKLRELRKKYDRPVAALLDTKGPEIRTKLLKDHKKITLEAGSEFTLTTGDIEGDETRVAITYENLYKDVKKGGKILIDDGLIELEIENIKNGDIVCRVLNGGELGERKGINVPYVKVKLPGITEQDKEDILFGITQEFDYIAASFVRDAKAIKEIRQVLDENGGHDIGIIAKIENAEGVENIDEIIKAADGIMVARGDLGVEIPASQVPHIQKEIIRKCNEHYTPVITATQMLDSMIKNPRPTRAEATDVANAIYDGTSAIMLSGETAAGKYPVEALHTMIKIAERAEEDIDYTKRFYERGNIQNPDITSAISHATCTTAIDLGAAAIVTVTKSGKTARMISKYRPKCPIIGCSPVEKVCRQLNLSWGVQPLLIAEENNTDDLFEHSVEAAKRNHYIKDGEIVVITAGVPLGVAGTTNLIKVHVVGHILVKGTSVNEKSVCAPLCVAETEEDLQKNYNPGDIIVMKETSNNIMEQLKTASAIVCEKDGKNSHAAIVGLSRDVPVIIGAKNATQILKTGAIVTVKAKDGVVVS